MKVTFINPNLTSAKSGDAMQPLAFAVLSGLTPPEVECAFFDERVQPIDFRDPTDLIALSVNTFTAKRAYAIADAYRAHGVPVVMGGFHPSLMPEEALEHADAVVIGDAEDAWPLVLRDAAAGVLRKIYRGDIERPLSGLVFDRSIFRGKKYQRLLPVQFGRGCRFACDFCCIHSFYGSTRRTRPPEEVAAEIKALGAGMVFFVDDNMLLDREKLRDLLERIIPLRVRWACQISIDAARDRSLLRLMRRSGCMAVYVGLESLVPDNVAQMGKGQNAAADYAEAVASFKEHGIMVCGAFVFGYDGDTAASVARSVRFARRVKLCLSHFNILFPTPGTPLYERLRREDRLQFGRWWMNDDYRYDECYLLPLRMSPDELKAAVLEARRSFNTIPCILRRALDLKANARTPYNLGVYFGVNLINRREMKRKIGLKLG